LCYIEAVENEIPGAYLAFLAAEFRPLQSLIRPNLLYLPIVNIRVSTLIQRILDDHDSLLCREKHCLIRGMMLLMELMED